MLESPPSLQHTHYTQFETYRSKASCGYDLAQQRFGLKLDIKNTECRREGRQRIRVPHIYVHHSLQNSSHLLSMAMWWRV